MFDIGKRLKGLDKLKTSKVDEVNPEIEKLKQEVEKYKGLYKGTKKDLQEKEKVNGELRSKLKVIEKERAKTGKELIEKLNSVADKELELANSIAELNEKKNSYQNTIKKLKSKNNKQKRRLEHIEETVSVIEEVVRKSGKLQAIQKGLTKTIELDTSILKMVNNILNILSQEVRSGKSALAKTSNRLGALRKISHTETKKLATRLGISDREKNKYKNRIQVLMEEVSNLKELDAESTLNTLHERLNVRNIEEFGKLEELFKKYNIIKEHNESQETIKEPTQELLYGTLHATNFKHVFQCINGKEYDIVNLNVYQYPEGSPLKGVLIDNDSIKIVKYYKDTIEMGNDRAKETSSKTTSPSKVKKTKDTEEEVIAPIGDVSVLILTEQSGSKFREELRKYGVKAEWQEAYGKNEKHIQEQMKKYDIVIFCTGAMPHSLRDFIGESLKFQEMESPNEKTIVQRVRYVARELGLGIYAK